MDKRWWWVVLIGLGGAVAAVAVPSRWARSNSADRILGPADVPATDIALVMGAGVRRDGQPTPVLRGRLDVARQLYAAGKVPRILVSGSSDSRGYSEPLVMRDYLVAHGVSKEDVDTDEFGVDTWQSCRNAVHDFQIRRATVVTSDFHLPRAVALCRRAGIDAYGVGHDAAADGLLRVAAKGSRREVLATIKAFWWRWRR